MNAYTSLFLRCDAGGIAYHSTFTVIHDCRRLRFSAKGR
jgi:hypothetical protein